MIRIFRLDGTFSTLPVTLSATASDLTNLLARKFQVSSSTSYALFLREKGLGKLPSSSHFRLSAHANRTFRPTERKVGPNEKPVLLQKRKFEQAGYTELDKLEELGREDNSYLSKLVYKATFSSMTTGVRLPTFIESQCLPTLTIAISYNRSGGGFSRRQPRIRRSLRKECRNCPYLPLQTRTRDSITQPFQESTFRPPYRLCSTLYLPSRTRPLSHGN